MYTLTETEVAALNGILASDFMDGANGADAIGKHVWAWSANPFENKKVFSGACSKLKQKRFIRCDGTGASSTIAITKQGFKALQASGNGKPAKPVSQPVSIPSQPAKRGPGRPRKAVEASLPVTPRVTRQDGDNATGNAPGKPSAIVTARKPRRVTMTVPAKTQQVVPATRIIALHDIIKLHWRDAIIVAEVVQETAKAWKLVALNQDAQDGFECWFPKSAFENIQNSEYQLAEWFFKYANRYTFSWLWGNIR